MKILFLGDVVGISGCSKIINNLKSEIDKKSIDFVIVNGENSAEPGVGLTEKTCKWPIGHPDEETFYFCGRKPEDKFVYCKLHVLYAFQPKGQKEDLITKEDEVPAFLEKKIKSA